MKPRSTRRHGASVSFGLSSSDQMETTGRWIRHQAGGIRLINGMSPFGEVRAGGGQQAVVTDNSLPLESKI